MLYEFEGHCLQEGNRHFIKIPFNVWEVCEIKGNIPVKVAIEEITFECKLIPKGHGEYYIPIAKKYYQQLPIMNHYACSFEILKQLSRINQHSPYNQPIRTIDTINLVLQPDEGLCGQACLAMLSGLPLEEIMTIMQAKKWQASLSKVIETLDYFRLKHADKMIYQKDKFSHLPNLCLLNVKADDDQLSHLLIYFNGKYYDPTSGIRASYDPERIISYLEIFRP